MSRCPKGSCSTSATAEHLYDHLQRPYYMCAHEVGALIFQPLKHLQSAVQACPITDVCRAFTLVLQCPLKRAHVPTTRSMDAGVLIPWTSVLASPLECAEISAIRPPQRRYLHPKGNRTPSPTAEASDCLHQRLESVECRFPTRPTPSPLFSPCLS